jgi:hypothetical protein
VRRFKIVTGLDARAGNPFAGPDGDLVIVSIDTLSGDRMLTRLREPDVAPYDLAILDEAHKLSARLEDGFTLRRTESYKLAEALAGVHSTDPDFFPLALELPPSATSHCHAAYGQGFSILLCLAVA